MILIIRLAIPTKLKFTLHWYLTRTLGIHYHLHVVRGIYLCILILLTVSSYMYVGNIIESPSRKLTCLNTYICLFK